VVVPGTSSGSYPTCEQSYSSAQPKCGSDGLPWMPFDEMGCVFYTILNYNNTSLSRSLDFPFSIVNNVVDQYFRLSYLVC
jgi:hypothetical protein